MDTCSNNNYNISPKFRLIHISTSNCTLILSCSQALRKIWEDSETLYRCTKNPFFEFTIFSNKFFCLFMEKAFCPMIDYIVSTIVIYKYISFRTRNIRLKIAWSIYYILQYLTRILTSILAFCLVSGCSCIKVSIVLARISSGEEEKNISISWSLHRSTDFILNKVAKLWTGWKKSLAK